MIKKYPIPLLVSLAPKNCPSDVALYFSYCENIMNLIGNTLSFHCNLKYLGFL